MPSSCPISQSPSKLHNWYTAIGQSVAIKYESLPSPILWAIETSYTFTSLQHQSTRPLTRHLECATCSRCDEYVQIHQFIFFTVTAMARLLDLLTCVNHHISDMLFCDRIPTTFRHLWSLIPASLVCSLKIRSYIIHINFTYSLYSKQMAFPVHGTGWYVERILPSNL